MTRTEGDDIGYHLNISLHELARERKIKHMMLVDSKGLLDKITTLQNGRENRLRKTVQRIRDNVEVGETNVIRWVQEGVHISNDLKNRIPEMNRIFTNKIWKDDIA